jgi:LEA14-like dessication related protein
LTRFINTVLITVFAFFVFLAIFWQIAGGGTGAGARGDPTVTDVSPRWQPAQPQELLVDLTVFNPAGQEGRIASVSYEAMVDGEPIDKALDRVPPGPTVLVGPKAAGRVSFPVDLSDGFATKWWPDYMEDSEEADLRIVGSVSLRRDDGVHEAPFEWRSTWTGQLAERLTAAVANCEDDPVDLCMRESRFYWEEGTLHATLTLHNPGPHGLAIRNSTLRLLFGERAVVSGTVDLLREIKPDTDTDVELSLTFSQKAIDAWWPDHIARCERTPLVLGMDLQVQELPQDDNATGQVTTLQWTFPAAPFETRFVCAQ